MNPPAHTLRHTKSYASLPPVTSELMKTKTRACDACRTKKSRCDGPFMPDGVCTRCTKGKRSCTYLNSSVPRGPPKAYVTALEDRLENLENLIIRLRPDVDLVEKIGPSIPRNSWKGEADLQEDIPRPSSNGAIPLRTIRSTPNLTFLRGSLSALLGRHYVIHSTNDLDSDSDYSDSELSDTGKGPTSVKQPMISAAPDGPGDLSFVGKNASSRLLERTRRLKRLHLASFAMRNQKHRFHPPSPDILPNRRPEFWNPPSWELQWENRDTDRMMPWLLGRFPPVSLCRELVDLYFTRSNIIYPLLHRPSFEGHWNQGLHERDPWFAGVCLSIFAVVSRMSEDKRVLPASEQTRHDPDWHQAGLSYAQAVTEIHINRGSLLTSACLFELQTLPLLTLYSRGTNRFSISWVLISMATLKSFDVGVHSRRRYRGQAVLDQELWKRVFFVIYVMDRLVSPDVGRQYAIREEDFDIDRPLSVDDEYLDANHPNFLQQPPGQPCDMQYFNHMITVCGIVGPAVEFMYSIQRGAGVSFHDKETIALLKRTNEALGKWLEAVPEHLIWSRQPSLNNPKFSNQSFMIYLAYTGLQTLLYRPFVAMDELLPFSTPAQELPPFAARALCTAAARTFARLIREQRGELYNVPAGMTAAYLGSALLLVSVWQLRQARTKFRKRGSHAEVQALSERIDSFMQDAEDLISSLEHYQPRWGMVTVYLLKLKSSLPQPRDDRDPSEGPIADRNVDKYPHAAPFLPPSPPDSTGSEKAHKSRDATLDIHPTASQAASHTVSYYGMPHQGNMPQTASRAPRASGSGHVTVPERSYQTEYAAWNHPLDWGHDAWYNAVPAAPSFDNLQPSYRTGPGPSTGQPPHPPRQRSYPSEQNGYTY